MKSYGAILFSAEKCVKRHIKVMKKNWTYSA